MRYLTALSVLVLCVCGCATIYQDQNTVMNEGFNQVYKDYMVKIMSEPAGAKVYWNERYIGTTPVSRVLDGHRGMCAPAVIRVHADGNGKYCRVMKFSSTDQIPREIYFDLTKPAGRDSKDWVIKP